MNDQYTFNDYFFSRINTTEKAFKYLDLVFACDDSELAKEYFNNLYPMK